MGKLQIMQNKLMRLLLNKDPTYSTNQLHKELRILKVSDIHRHFTLKFVYKCLSGDVIQNFANYFATRENVHNHNTRYIQHIQRPQIRTELGRSSTHYTAATLWNELPVDIKQSSSDYIFKKKTFNSILTDYDT